MRSSDGLSVELQVGKAAEHLVVADLILRGRSAFLADQGLPFDVVVSQGSKLLRVQVKAASKPIFTKKNNRPHYRFDLRHGRGGRTPSSGSGEFDIAAFVALDVRAIGYVHVSELLSREHGYVVLAVDFYLKEHQPGAANANRHVSRRALWGRFLDDYTRFPPKRVPARR